MVFTHFMGDFSQGFFLGIGIRIQGSLDKKKGELILPTHFAARILVYHAVTTVHLPKNSCRDD
jgi:hypothetical protein